MKRFQVVALVALMLHPVFSNVFLFKIKRGEKQSYVQWNIVHKVNGAIDLSSVNKMEGAYHHLVCDSSMNTKEWRYQKQEQKTDYKVRQDGEELIFDGFVIGHVSYWFRSNDHTVIKYKGISGFPGTPPVTYELIKTASCASGHSDCGAGVWERGKGACARD